MEKIKKLLIIIFNVVSVLTSPIWILPFMLYNIVADIVSGGYYAKESLKNYLYVEQILIFD